MKRVPEAPNVARQRGALSYRRTIAWVMWMPSDGHRTAQLAATENWLTLTSRSHLLTCGAILDE
jgi:hypothetical protein